ncbi:hypothetical protein K438DRAFT_2017207 [Mycena galopus ATCC 62051]|nr:hypothetical protein K438DRAFT_2017207 [Mycena galopus ATCC 62051]
MRASLHRSGIPTNDLVFEHPCPSICKRVDRARPTASLADDSVFSFASQHNIGCDALGDYDATGHTLDAPALTTSPLTLFDTPQALWFLDPSAALVNPGVCNTSTRCVHSPSRTPFSLPPARDDYRRQCPSLPRLSFSCSPKYHPHAPPACGALAGCSAFFYRRTTTIDASPLRLPGLPSTQGYPTRPPRGATGMHSARRRPRLNHQEAIVAHSRRPPRQSPLRWSVISAIRRDYQRRRLSQGTVSSATTLTPRDSKPTTCCTRCTALDAVPRRHARHHASAHPSPDPHHQPHGQRVTLASVVPGAAFVASSCSATVLTAVAPNARAAHALQYHPQHVPRRQHAPRSFLIAGAAVAFSYATAIRSPHHWTRAAWRNPNTTPSLTR